MRSVIVESQSGKLYTNIESRKSVWCPMAFANANLEDLACYSQCAWFNTKRVTDGGEMGAFCGDKFIGNIAKEDLCSQS
jgi:hypothetical protein